MHSSSAASLSPAHRFDVSLGLVLIQPAVVAAVPIGEIRSAIERHRHGDWGDATALLSRTNDEALAAGSELLSSYHSFDGTPFWISTDPDHALTEVWTV